VVDQCYVEKTFLNRAKYRGGFFITLVTSQVNEVRRVRRNIPKDIKSLKSKFFISLTSILCKMEINNPVTRLPAVKLLRNIVS